MQASTLKKGDYIQHKGKKGNRNTGKTLIFHLTKTGKICEVVKIQHVTQGQRSAYMQAELMEYPSGKKYYERFRSSEVSSLFSFEMHHLLFFDKKKHFYKIECQ